MACQFPLAALNCCVGHSYATHARSAWDDSPSTRFLNEMGNDPSLATSLPSKLPSRSYICVPMRTAILVLSRQTPPR
jgi:hypothetical protein